MNMLLKTFSITNPQSNTKVETLATHDNRNKLTSSCINVSTILHRQISDKQKHEKKFGISGEPGCLNSSIKAKQATAADATSQKNGIAASRHHPCSWNSHHQNHALI